MTEQLDILDDKGNVIGVASQEEVYEKKLSHRIVHVLVLNPATQEVYLQRRAATKSFLPGYYCTSAGGHVQSGETYEQAAKRELYEEIGLKISLQKVHQFLFEADSHKRFVSLFIGFHSQDFHFNNSEVDSGQYFSLDQALFLIEKGDKVHPQLTPCIQWLHQNQDKILREIKNSLHVT